MRQKYFKETKSGIISETAQNLTTGWVIYGSEIDVTEFNMITLWMVLDINGGSDMRFQVRMTRTPGGTEYLLPVYTVSSSVIRWEGQYYEYNVDADTNLVERFDISEARGVKLYVHCGATGGTAPQIDSAYYSLSTAVA